MTLAALTRDQSRAVDRIAIEEYGMNGLVLMENAGRESARRLAEVAPAGQVTVLCGGGNNAGDGYVIARHLELMGRSCNIISLLPLDKLSGDAAVNARIAEKAKLPISVVKDAEQLAGAFESSGTVVDCLLGTGARGPLREPFKSAVAFVNELSVMRVAIDVPSGLDCDSGKVHDPTFMADETISFVAPKTGFTLGDNAVAHVGNVHVIGIGVPKRLLDSLSRR